MQDLKIKAGLTTRQWRLYDYLKEQENFVKQHKIVDDLQKLYGGVPNESFHDSQQRHRITKDLRALKSNEVIQIVIISDARGIKLATKEEAKAHFKSERKRIFKQLKILRIQEKKALKHMQTRIVFNKEKNTMQAYKEVAQ